jgi:hypothetical protein
MDRPRVTALKNKVTLVKSGHPAYSRVSVALEGPVPPTTRSDREPDEPATAEGGDPVCWLHQLCPNCGAMPDDGEICWRCSRPLDRDE